MTRKPLTPEQLTALRAVPVTADLPNRIRIAMALADVTQVEVAEGVELTQATVSDIRNGKYNDLKHSTVQRLASFFGCAIEDLFPARQAVAS